MKVNYRFWLTILYLLPSSVFAEFNHFRYSGRSAGMADAFVAVADDAGALRSNPAGLIQTQHSRFGTLTGEIISGADDNSRVINHSINFIRPFTNKDWGVAGIGYQKYTASTLASEQLFQVSYARNVNLHLVGLSGQSSIGISLKGMTRKYESTVYSHNAINEAGVSTGQADPLFKENGFSKTVASADFGFLHQFGWRDRFYSGISIINANKPSTSLDGQSSRAPRLAQFGLAYRNTQHILSLQATRAELIDGVKDNEYALGAEKSIFINHVSHIALRGGYGFGTREYRNLTSGISIFYKILQIDYGFKFPLGNLDETIGTHTIGLSFIFGSRMKTKRDTSRNNEVQLATLPDINSVLNDEKGAVELFFNQLKRKIDYTPRESQDITNLLTFNQEERIDWIEKKRILLKSIHLKEKGVVEGAIGYFFLGNDVYTLSFINSLSTQSQQNKIIKGIHIMSLARLASRSYNSNDYDKCAESLRRILTLLPDNRIARHFYHQYLVLKMNQLARVPDSHIH